jgi:hypothetical protein
MHVDVIREAIRRQPFVPFVLKLSDGQEFHIPHPDYVAVSGRSVYVVNPVTDAGIFLEPVLIASLQPASEPPKSTPETTSGGNT